MAVVNLNKPDATDELKQSQRDILAYNREITQMWIKDHGAPNLNQPGKHGRLSFNSRLLVQPTFGVNEIGMYVGTPQNPLPTGGPELMLVDTTGKITPITMASRSSQGWTYLPSGYVMIWGNLFDLTGDVTINLTGLNYPTLTVAMNAIVSTCDLNFAVNAVVTILSLTTTELRVYISEPNSTNPDTQSIAYCVTGIGA